MPKTSHQDLIVDQFTRQALAFSTAKTIANEEALQLLLDITDAGPDDTVLDVACGGGRLGIPIRLEGPQVHYAYPVAVLAATRP